MKLRSIQVLRAVAAIAVVLRHSDDRFAFGAIGVDLFFVISGFIIATVAPGRAPLDFLAARFWRIFPLYWIAAMPWLAIATFEQRIFAPETLATFILIPVAGQFSYLGVAWTLAYELLFYAGAAVALWSKRPLLVVAALGMVVLLRGVTGQATFAGSPIIFEFLLGVGLAFVPRIPALAAVIGAAAAAWLIAVPSVHLEDWRIVTSFTPAMHRVGLWGIPCMMLAYAALTFERAFASRHFDTLVWLGGASYAIYLVHLLAIRLTPDPWWLQAACGVAVGAMAHRWIEQPVLKRRTAIGEIAGRTFRRHRIATRPL